MALFFHSDDVDEFLSLTDAVRVAEDALRNIPGRQGVNAPRKRLNLHRQFAEATFDTVLNIYAGGSASYGAIGAQVALHRKTIEGNVQKTPPYNPDQTELAHIYDVDTGSLLAIMAHRPRHVKGVADLRTPATSLVGLDQLARKDARRVGIYGSGHQAISTFMGLTEMRRIEKAKVYSPTKAHREEFAKVMSEQTGVMVEPVTEPRAAAKDVDIILCMTNTVVPVIDGSWLEEGQYIISVVGSNIELVKSGALDKPRREIDDGTLKRCSFIVALSKEQAIDSQQGDIYWPVQNGVIDWEKIVEIADILAGKAPGRTDDKLQEPGWARDYRHCPGQTALRTGAGKRLRHRTADPLSSVALGHGMEGFILIKVVSLARAIVLLGYFSIFAPGSLHAESVRIPYSAISWLMTPVWMAEELGFFNKYSLEALKARHRALTDAVTLDIPYAGSMMTVTRSFLHERRDTLDIVSPVTDSLSPVLN